MFLVIFLAELKLTVLADDLSMRLLIMLILLALGDYLSADGALIVHSGATDLMHPVLAHLDLALASAAFLSRLRSSN